MIESRLLGVLMLLPASRLVPLAAVLAIIAGATGGPPAVLPAQARAQLVRSLEQSRPHAPHVWRDTPSVNPDGTVNAYIEISRGDRTKWEYDMALDRRRVDRVLPEELAGYPVNYGFVPQTVSYDGDPFDVLVLGPPIEGARLVRGRAVGLMIMADEKGHDPKVVLSLTDQDGEALHQLVARDRAEFGRFFDRYKRHEPGKYSKVSGWGSAADGIAYVRITHLFFERCRDLADSPCDVSR